jgi:hypothetical protein
MKESKMEDRLVVIPRSRLPMVGFFVGVALIIALGIVGYLGYRQLMFENAQLRNEVTEFKQLTETLVRASTQWTTKSDLKDSLANLMTTEDLKALRSDMRKQGAVISAVGRTVGQLDGRISKLEQSDSQGPVNDGVVKCEDGRLVDTHRYTERTQTKRVKDKNEAAVADVTFDASKSKPWDYKVFGRQYNLTTVLSKKDSGQLNFYNVLKYKTEADGNKEFPITLSSSDFKQANPESKFYWLNPRLDLGIFAGAKALSVPLLGNDNTLVSVGADLGLSLMSYGETKVESWWRFARFGAGYNINRDAFQLSFAPALFNVGKVLPLITNMYLGPNVGLDSGGGMTINLGLGVQL